MVQIETYKGTVEELVEFVNRVWTHSYAGKMTFPSWTTAFFEWQFRLNSDTSRQYLIAAYDGEILAGVLLGTSYPFRSPAGLHGGAQWSWLSIDPAYRNRGIVKALHQERIRRHSLLKSPLIVSYRYVGSVHSQAERPCEQSLDTKFNRKVGFWVRVLNSRRFAQWHWNRFEGWLAQIASPLMPVPASARTDVAVRAFLPGDLDRCLQLARDAQASTILSIAWDQSTLRHQLCGHEISQTLLIEEGGETTGFVNFHLLSFQARTIEKVGIFDLMVLKKTSAKGRIRLLNAALARIQEQGAIAALKVRCGDTAAWPLLRTHFIPERPDSLLVLQSVDDRIDIPKSAPVHLLWR